MVGTQFFKTLEIPIVAGRDFGPQDTANSHRVGIINLAMARNRFPNQNPIGKRFRLGSEGDSASGPKSTGFIEIVGVCGDTRYADLRNAPPPQFFLPYVQRASAGAMTYEIRTNVPPETIVPMLRRALQEVDPNLPLNNNVRTQEQQIEAAMQQERVFVALTSGFGLLALALASVGIYGIMAYSVAQRTNEIGIRLALGAQRRQMRGMILRESTRLALTGAVVGVMGALLFTGAIKSMLYGIAPYDPLTVSAGVGLLLAVALVASWIPASRAAGVQPMEALRHE